jgi:hypothetical protein
MTHLLFCRHPIAHFARSLAEILRFFAALPERMTHSSVSGLDARITNTERKSEKKEHLIDGNSRGATWTEEGIGTL